jgi:hypothetical protein
VAQFAVSATSPVALGGNTSVIVTAEDVNGYTNTTYTGTVHFTSTDAAAGLPANYAFTSGDNGQHTFSVTLNTAGSKTVTATDTTTPSITGASNSITVNQGSQTISFTAPATPVIYGIAPISLSATATSSLTVAFTVASGPCTIASGATTVSITGAGSCVINANQAGNTNYTAAAQVQQTIVVNVASQTISFTAPATPVTYGITPISLSATATSSLTVAFTVASGPCTIASGAITVTITGAGSCVINANQAGNTNYTAATQMQQTIVVNAASQTINFTAPTTPVVYGVAPIALVATGGASGNAVAFTVASGPCTIASGATTVSITGVGSCVINANQAGNTNYTAATQVQKTIVVNQAAVSIGTSTITESYGNIASGTATVSGVSGGTTPAGTLSYAIDGGTATNETLSSGQGPISIPKLNGGSHALTLSYLGDSNYAATTTATVVNFTVTLASTTVALVQTAPTTAGVGTGVNTTFTATVTGFLGAALPTGNVQFFDGSTSLGMGSVTAGVATLTTSFSTTGSHSITAVYLGDGNYATSTSAIFNEVVAMPGFTVAANPNTLTIAHGSTGTATLTFTPTGNYTGTVTLNCSGLPQFSSCQFTPASVTFTGNNAQQTSQLVIYTLNAHDAPGATPSGLLWLPAGVLACIVALRRRKLGRTLRPLLMLVIAAMVLAGLAGCGSGATFITPTGSDTVTVTATGTSSVGTTTQTATITVTIIQ